MACIKGIMSTFLSFGESTETVELTKSVESVAAAGKYFVNISLMTYVPYDFVHRTVKDLMKSYCKLHYTKIGSKVSSGCRDFID